MFNLPRLTSSFVITVTLLSNYVYASDQIIVEPQTEEISHNESLTTKVSTLHWLPLWLKKTAEYTSSKISKYTGWSKSQDHLLEEVNKPKVYKNKHFKEDILCVATSEEYSLSEHRQLRLRRLQDHVWNGEISPYTYDQGLKYLEPHIPKAALSQVRVEFEAKVKSFQSFLESNFQRDLLCSLEDSNLKDSSSFVDFEELISYYRALLNPLDYTNMLTQFGEWVVRRNYLREDQRKAIYAIILKNLQQIDTKKYRKIKSERRSIEVALQEFPFYHDNLPKGFNLSLPKLPSNARLSVHTDKIGLTNENNLSFGSALKGLAYAFDQGTRYTVSPPSKLLVLGLMMHFVPIAAQLQDQFAINQISANYQSHPSVSSLINGNVFVAWQDYRNGASDIYGKIFYPDGTVSGNDFLIGLSNTPDSGDPVVTGLTNGNAFVAWCDQDDLFSYSELYGRVFDPNGTALGVEFIIDQLSTGISANPSVSALTDGNVFVAWHDYQLRTYDTFGRVFLPNGTGLGNKFLINQITINNQWLPAVSGLPNGNVFVAWRNDGAGNSGDIYGRVFFPSGIALGNEFIINQTSVYRNSYPTVAALTNGNVFVAWVDSSTTIYGKIFLSDGTAQGTEFIINQIIYDNLYGHLASALPNGNLFVVWYGDDSGDDITVDNIYGRAFLSDGTATIESELSITQSSTDSSPEDQRNPSATGLTNDNVFVAWEKGTGIYGRILLNSDLSDADSWQIPAAIGGSIGSAALIGGVSVILAKKYCSKGKKSDKPKIELVEEPDKTPDNSEIPTSSRFIPSFEATPEGYTEHPTFVGNLRGHTYVIWKKISSEEAELLRPLTSMNIPDLSSSKNVKFTLGQGDFSATYAGRNTQTNEICAIKEVQGKSAIDASLREEEIVPLLGDYPHIMPLRDYTQLTPSEKNQEPRLLLVMPLAYINGVGFNLLLKGLDKDKRAKLVSDTFLQMMLGLGYIHKQGVVHLDIKADTTLYMKEGTLRIADFGRAQHVGQNDEITDMYSLGDIRKFSPEAMAFIRKCLGKTFETADSFSGKGADVWAAGLYVWELLEDNTDNLFSLQREIPLETRAATYNYEYFEELVATISSLKGSYSSSLINLIRLVLTVDPELRVKTSQVVKKLANSAISYAERNKVFEELINTPMGSRKASKEHKYISVYPSIDPALYIKKSRHKQKSSNHVPSDLYSKQ